MYAFKCVILSRATLYFRIKEPQYRSKLSIENYKHENSEPINTYSYEFQNILY